MVDSISSSGGSPGFKRLGDDASKIQRGKVGGQIAPTETSSAPIAPSVGPAAAGDTSEIRAASPALPQALQSGPPIEMALVTRIQEAIADGNYPIDLEKITESLFQSYLELNN